MLNKDRLNKIAAKHGAVILLVVYLQGFLLRNLVREGLLKSILWLIYVLPGVVFLTKAALQYYKESVVPSKRIHSIIKRAFICGCFGGAILYGISLLSDVAFHCNIAQGIFETLSYVTAIAGFVLFAAMFVLWLWMRKTLGSNN